MKLRSTIFSSGRYVLAGTNKSDDDTGFERRVKRLILHPKFSVGPYWLNADHFDIKQVQYTLRIKSIPKHPTHFAFL